MRKKLAQRGVWNNREDTEFKFVSLACRISRFCGRIQGLTPAAAKSTGAGIVIRIYSAAAGSAVIFADERMKSEMRGTISDLNREPLNTP